MSMRSLYSLALGVLALLSIAGCKKSSEEVYDPTSDGVVYLRIDAAGLPSRLVALVHSPMSLQLMMMPLTLRIMFGS